MRRRPLLLALLAVGVLGAVLIFALQARPDATALVQVDLSDARVGTAYAVDGALCLDSPGVGAEVRSVDVEQAPGSRTQLLQPAEDSRPTIGFPVDPEAAGADPTGYVVEAGEPDCTLRVLVTPTEVGRVEAGTVRVELAYGPFGLLRRTAEVQPQVALDVTGTGPDPRSALD